MKIAMAADHGGYEAEYKRRSLVLGKQVDLIPTGGGKIRRGKVLDITEDCNLLVEFPDKTTEVLSSGEVSVRPKDLKK